MSNDLPKGWIETQWQDNDGAWYSRYRDEKGHFRQLPLTPFYVGFSSSSPKALCAFCKTGFDPDDDPFTHPNGQEAAWSKDYCEMECAFAALWKTLPAITAGFIKIEARPKRKHRLPGSGA